MILEMSVYFRCAVSAVWELVLAIFKVTYRDGPAIVLI